MFYCGGPPILRKLSYMYSLNPCAHANAQRAYETDPKITPKTPDINRRKFLQTPKPLSVNPTPKPQALHPHTLNANPVPSSLNPNMILSRRASWMPLSPASPRQELWRFWGLGLGVTKDSYFRVSEAIGLAENSTGFGFYGF